MSSEFIILFINALSDEVVLLSILGDLQSWSYWQTGNDTAEEEHTFFVATVSSH
jgi:hypothetical protein